MDEPTLRFQIVSLLLQSRDYSNRPIAEVLADAALVEIYVLQRAAKTLH